MTTSFKRLAVTAATATLGAGLLLPASPAMAAPAGAQGTAPACVHRDVIKQEKKVTIGNYCGTTMHVKLVINNGPDGQCWSYRNGEAVVWRWSTGSYGKVVTC
ncbi:hypothetical protein [Streptomyces bambusae]|uniref:Uncharacterized protein n=1 Tax=Streptomyces bambusae TaxID=1550616 RepID=A0ABS6ZAS7_9ACTN|nr:hypothetical protein [Streptomyces bambusae]MBW5484873.1 hypothetical protein [Streptomyces bambusae]